MLRISIEVMNVIDRLLEDALDYVVSKKCVFLDIFGKFIVFI